MFFPEYFLKDLFLSKRLIYLLEKYDSKSIAYPTKPWSLLTLEEKYFALEKRIGFQAPEETEKNIVDNKVELSKGNVFNILMLLLRIQCDKDYTAFIFQSLTTDYSLIKSDLIKADAHGIIAYFFLCTGNYESAYELYKQSAEQFEKLSMSSQAWLCRNNMNTCLLQMKKFKVYQENLPILLSDYYELHEEAKAGLGAILFWQTLHAGKIKEAHDILYLSYSIARELNSQNREELYGRYLYYIEKIWLKTNKYNSLFKDTGNKKFIETSHEKSKKELIDQLAKWSTINYYDKYHYTDLLFNHLYLKRKFTLLIDAFKYFEKNLFIEWRLVTPPRSIYFSPCLAAKELGKNTLHLRYLSTIKKESSPLEFAALKRKLRSISANQQKITFYLDHTTKLLSLGSFSWNLKQSPKVFSFFNELTKAQETLKVSELISNIYKEDNSCSSSTDKVVTLIRRSLAMIDGASFFKLENGILLKVSSHQ